MRTTMTLLQSLKAELLLPRQVKVATMRQMVMECWYSRQGSKMRSLGGERIDAKGGRVPLIDW